MDKLKKIWQYQFYLSVFFIVTTLLMIFINQTMAQGDILMAVKRSYVLTFIVANSDKTFGDVSALFLMGLLLKDILYTIFVTSIIVIYNFIYRSIVKHIFGYIKLFFVALFLLLLSVCAILNMYVVHRVGLHTQFVVIENIITVVMLLMMMGLYVWFTYCYIQYRRANQIALFSRQSFLQTAYKTIKNTTIILFVSLSSVIFVAIFASKISLYVIQQLSLENYLESLYHFDMMQLFKDTPPIMQQMIVKIQKDDWFYTIQNGVVVIDVHAIDLRIQTQLNEYVQNNVTWFVDVLLKTAVFYVVLNILNFFHARKKFLDLKFAYAITFFMCIKIWFFKSDFILFNICDMLFMLCSIIYFIDAVDKQFFNSELAIRINEFFKENIGKYTKFKKEDAKSLWQSYKTQTIGYVLKHKRNKTKTTPVRDKKVSKRHMKTKHIQKRKNVRIRKIKNNRRV